MTKKLIYILALFALSLSSYLPATSITPNIQVRSLYFEEEHEDDYTYKVLKDKQGYLWSATDHGLKRYDGYQNRLFTPNEKDPKSLGSMSIVEMLIYNEVLWLGGNKLSRYHPETESFSNYNISDNHAIWALHQSSSEVIWLGGEGFGLRGFDLIKKQVTKQYFDTAKTRFIYGIVPDNKSNKLWLSTNNGLYRFSPETGDIEHHLKPEDLPSQDAVFGDLIINDIGEIWITSNFGLITYNPNTKHKRVYRHKPGDNYSISSDKLTSIYVDKSQQIWLGTDKRGINLYDQKIDAFHQILPSKNTTQHRLPAVAINDIFQDKQQSYWIATAFGIKRLSPHLERFTYLTHVKDQKNSLTINNVLDLHQSKNGVIWIATDGGGLNKFEPISKNISHYVHNANNKNSLSSNSVISIAEDKFGKLWLGTYAGGLNKFDPDTGQFSAFLHDKNTSHLSSIGGNNIFKVVIDENQNILFSIWRTGLQIYNPTKNQFTSYFPGGTGSESGISNYSINDIEPTGDGGYWIGGHNGLELFYPEQERFEKIVINGINDILDIFVDKDIIWLATMQGLVKYNILSHDIKKFMLADGLPSEFLVSIEQDQLGMLWLGSRSGLIKFDPINESFKLFTKHEGLISNSFNRHSYLQTSSGTMYFGGPKGINIFDPKKTKGNLHQPEVVITELRVNKTAVNNTNALILSKHDSFSQTISLKYFENDIIINFAALDFIAPNKNKYRYILNGLENDWNEVGAKAREVRYTNLDPGEYVFEVLGSNNEALWGNQKTSLIIQISPPWWKTWWAIALFFLFSVMAIYAFIYWRTIEQQLRAKLLEKKVTERTHELAEVIEELKSTQDQLIETEKMASLGKLVAGVAHEINTPLGVSLMATSSIESQFTQLFTQLEEKKLSNQSYQLFKSNINTGIELSLSNIRRIRELVSSFKQVAVWQSEEKASKFILVALVETCLLSYSEQFKQQGISVNINCPNDFELTSFKSAMSEIINRLLNNSLTHGFKNLGQGEININICQISKQRFLFTYQDNGQGIDDETLKDIFEPFFTTNRFGGSAGLGLHIVYNLVTQQLQGTIKAEKQTPGIKFILNLPNQT